jgi:hypothetical protein
VNTPPRSSNLRPADSNPAGHANENSQLAGEALNNEVKVARQALSSSIHQGFIFVLFSQCWSLSPQPCRASVGKVIEAAENAF